LLAIKAKATGGCASLQAAAQGATGVQVGDLGETEVKDLAPAFRDAVEKLQPNQISDPVRTPAGLHLIAVCGRSVGGSDIPTKQEIATNLKLRELSLIERRELRNLRLAATVSQPR
jgi:peptidyl-prolyl cis-trans isomerase SurA